MYYIYSVTIWLSFILLLLLLTRVFINKKNINFKNNKYNWKTFVTLIIVSIIPVLNIVFAISSAYLCILMKREKFIKFMNE